MSILRETCLEYLRRRLSEGWKCVSLEGYNAVLLSPEGIRRELDLRNDVETLRPNAAGDECNIPNEVGAACPNHYQNVDEAVADDDTTYVYHGLNNGDWYRDLYALSDPTGSGTINKVTVWIRAKSTTTYRRYIAIALKTNGVAYNSGLITPPKDVWTNYSWEHTVNPQTSAAWTWGEISALQAGCNLYDYSGDLIPCTQVYVEVDYTTLVVASNAATGIITSSAILNGTLEDDLGEGWDVRFQWGKTEDYGNNTDWQDGGFTTGDTFTQLINTLESGTLYHFRAQAKNSLGTVSGRDVAFWTLKPSVGKAYAFSRELHIKRATDVVDKASIAASGITTLADCRGLNLVEVPSSLTLTVEATYDAAAAQGIKVHVRTSLTDRAVGTHTGADGAAALTDAEAHFVDDELIGLTIKNLTDGSSGAITGNTATEVTATLVGGTNNDWDAGDAYIIEGAGYDTEDFDSWVPTFDAGSSIRQTKNYDVDPVFLKAFVENLDGAEAVTDVKIIMAVGT